MKWYVIQVYSGYEKQVLQSIQEALAKHNLTDKVKEIFVPTKDADQTRYGKRTVVKKKLTPGYIFIEADLDSELLLLLKSIPRVSGFVGGLNDQGMPYAVEKAEIDKLIEGTNSTEDTKSKDTTFEIGEMVHIKHGPFASFDATIDEIDEEKRKLKVAVSIFGRQTLVELEYYQVEKNK